MLRRSQFTTTNFDVVPTLAEDFQIELERSRSIIARSLTTWPQYIHGTQRYLMKRFPYFVVYRASATQIEIVAIAHERQQLGYWADRTPLQ